MLVVLLLALYLLWTRLDGSLEGRFESAREPAGPLAGVRIPYGLQSQGGRALRGTLDALHDRLAAAARKYGDATKA